MRPTRSATLRPAVLFVLFSALPIGALGSDVPGLPPGLGAENIPISFKTENGWEYDGRIELPQADRRNSWAVLLLGGGIGSPIDWEIPGIMTLDGKPTHDGDALAQALLDAGFAVMRWHAVRRGDLERAKDPLMMERPDYPQTIEQARKALAAFREKRIIADDHVFLLGHSLGAQRAGVLLQENPKLAGIVMLAGAQLIPADLGLVEAFLARGRVDFAKRDANKDGFLAGEELPARAEGSAGPTADFSAWDLNGDGRYDRHEWVVFRLAAKLEARPKGDSGLDRTGNPWAVDVISRLGTPTLLLAGSQDERWLIESYLVTIDLRRAKHRDYTWRVFEDRGHQLGKEVQGDVKHPEYGVIADSRTGPIDPQVVAVIVDWLKARSK